MSAHTSAELSELQLSYFNGDQNRCLSIIRRHQLPGHAVPAPLATSISQRLDFNFAHVRLHTCSNANRLARALQAKAFTLENEIFFAAREFDPFSAAGTQLLTHELVHVVQQSPQATGKASAELLLEQEASRIAFGAAPAEVKHRVSDPIVLREPTLPRRCTREALVRATERILALSRNPGAADETTQMWSRVDSNFGAVTIGSIARRVWTYMFLRHFVDPDYRPGIESIFPRYFYSQRYGWIDGQHFFGFIDYAEQQNSSNSNEDGAFAAATAQGVQIERDQQRVRDTVIQGAPPDPGVLRFIQVRPPNTPLFRTPQMVAGGLAGLGASLYGSLTLSGTQGELFAQLDESRRQKFFLDSAKSAFSYEDIPSNQMGIVFYFRYKDSMAGLPSGSAETAFISHLDRFLRDNGVENDQAMVDRQAIASGLPMKERYLAPTATEADIRKRYPDLFQLPAHATAAQ